LKKKTTLETTYINSNCSWLTSPLIALLLCTVSGFTDKSKVANLDKKAGMGRALTPQNVIDCVSMFYFYVCCVFVFV